MKKNIVRIQSRRKESRKANKKESLCVGGCVKRIEKRQEKRERAMQHNIPFLSLIQHISNFNLYVM